MLLGIELDTVSQELRIDPTRLAEIIDLLDSWSTKRHCTKRQLQSLLASLTLFSLCATPGERYYILRWMFDGIMPSTTIPFGGEISVHPGRVVASSMTTNGPPHHIMIFTPTHASLASVAISQATGSTGHSQTTTSPVPFSYVQGALLHYHCRLHLGSILCLSLYSAPLG